MTNLTKLKRDKMINFLEELKETHTDDESLRAFNEIENALTEKKFGLVFEEHEEEVDERLLEEIPVFCADETRKICKDKNLPYNFIIEGDNLQALYLLEKTHRGRVDCIYIDPPYNNRNRSWKYNNDYVDSKDEYKHSKWLSMMKNRLLAAKKLLNPYNSVLICTIDEKEYLHLGCLLEELFPTAKIQMISLINSKKGVSRFNEFSRVNEFIFFVMIGDYKLAALDELDYVQEGEDVHWQTFRRSDYASRRGTTKGGTAQFYPIYVDDETHKIVKIGKPLKHDESRAIVPEVKGCTPVFPIRDDGTEMNWGLKNDNAEIIAKKGYIRAKSFKPNKPQQYVIQYLMGGTIEAIEKGEVEVIGRNPDGSVIAKNLVTKKTLPKTQWNNPGHDARDYGTYILKDIFLNQVFDFPKSLYAVYDSIKYFVEENKDAIVVDFFAGSGTTMHAVNLLNAKDGGNRKCIMVTNNEMSEDEENELKDLGFEPGDEEWESKGVAKAVTWPRTLHSIEGKNINGKPIKGKYGVKVKKFIKNEDYTVVSKSTKKPINRKIFTEKNVELYSELSELNKSDGFNANVKYFKCDWTPRKPMDYLLSNVLLLHIKEMIELEHFIEIDNERYVVILNKDDFKKYILDENIYSKIETVWVNQNIIFTYEELKLLRNKEFKYIPREYFGQELKEAAE